MRRHAELDDARVAKAFERLSRQRALQTLVRGALPTSLSIHLLSSDLSMRADLVWQLARGEQAWVCGAAVSQTSAAAARQWRGLVDTVS